MLPAARDGKSSGKDLLPRGSRRSVVVSAAAPTLLVLAATVLLVGASWRAEAVGGAAAVATLPLVIAMLRQSRRNETLVAEIARARAGENRFRTLAESSADMIVKTGLDMVCRYVSPCSLELLGFAPEELLGRTVLEFVHADDAPAFETIFKTLLDGARDRMIATQRYRRRDGTYVWTEANIRVLRGVSGEPAGYSGSLRDVSARRAAEQALRESETFLRSVVDGSPDSIKVLDLDGRVTFVSRNGVGITPVALRDRILGRDILAIWPQQSRTTAASALAAAASGAQARFAARQISETGEVRHLDVLVSPMLGAAGRPERLLVITRDVTAEAAARAAFLESQSRYRLLAENSSDVVLLLRPGPDGAVLFASPSSRAVLGYTPDRVLESPDPSLAIHLDDRARVRALLAGLVPGSGPVRDTHRVRRADGTYLWVEAAFQLAEREGEPVVVAALRDVGERQRRAEDLAAAKEMAERARAAAEDANLAKGDFLAVMSHEIRTPMNSIIGFTDLMLQADDLSATTRRQAELIRAAGGAMLTMVNDILDFSKIEAGAIELEALAFDPLALVHQSAAIAGGYAESKGLAIAVETEAGPAGPLVGDEARLRQILMNLLNNAVKFTARGLVTLRLAVTGEGPAGVALRFSVEDTGVGIPEARQHRLFERFDQLDTSVARRFGGSGLGLAISKQLVGLMGGEIGVNSREGEGATFWFAVTLPRARRGVAPADEPSRRAARILVADDLDANRRLAAALLETAGHAVRLVVDGMEAVAAADAEPFDLVLMDVRMPGLDGIAATRAIRRGRGPNAGAPIVAMTANVYPDQIEACRRAGMDAHVGKPLDRTQLLTVIDRLLAADPGQAAQAGRGEAERARVAGAGEARTFDPATYAELGDVLGEGRLGDVVARFAALLPATFAPSARAEDSAERWAADAHFVVSIAGMLGFEDLARCCRALQAEQPGSDGFRACLAAVREARDAALPRLAALHDTASSRTSSAA